MSERESNKYSRFVIEPMKQSTEQMKQQKNFHEHQEIATQTESVPPQKKPSCIYTT